MGDSPDNVADIAYAAGALAYSLASPAAAPDHLGVSSRARRAEVLMSERDKSQLTDDEMNELVFADVKRSFGLGRAGRSGSIKGSASYQTPFYTRCCQYPGSLLWCATATMTMCGPGSM
jgi:hypothetical protein